MYVQSLYGLVPGTPSDYFGFAVSVSGNTIVVGADDNFFTGEAYVFTKSGSSWVYTISLRGMVLGSTPEEFGQAVAVHGDTNVIGAPKSDSGEAGDAYVFAKSGGGTWGYIGALRTLISGSPRDFGRSVAVDNNTIVVGACESVSAGETDGNVYTFVWTGSTLTLTAPWDH